MRSTTFARLALAASMLAAAGCGKSTPHAQFVVPRAPDSDSDGFQRLAKGAEAAGCSVVKVHDDAKSPFEGELEATCRGVFVRFSLASRTELIVVCVDADTSTCNALGKKIVDGARAGTSPEPTAASSAAHP